MSFSNDAFDTNSFDINSFDIESGSASSDDPTEITPINEIADILFSLILYIIGAS